MGKTKKPYRKNAGIVVFNSQGLLLAGERINSDGSWQFPQGGIDNNEKPLEAARRELYEEMGLKLFEPVAEIAKWLHYEFPKNVPKKLKKFRGQKQKWYLFFWDGNPDELKLDNHEQEFERVAWKGFDFLSAQIVEFKKDLYKKLEELSTPIINNYLKRRK